MMRSPTSSCAIAAGRLLVLLAILLATPARAADAPQILSRDHYVEVRSTVPAIAGQPVKLYVRERVSAAMAERITGDKVVLFVHGAGTPGSVAFDVPYQDYSWMAFLAAAGWAAQHPGEVSKLVLLVPGYSRTARVEAPSPPEPAPVFNTQSRAEFPAFWDHQTAGPDHYDPRTVESVWSEMPASDPVGTTWGPGVRRAPEVTRGAGGPRWQRS